MYHDFDYVFNDQRYSKWPPRFQPRVVVALPALSDFLLKWQGTGFCSHRWMCEIWHTETFVLKEQNRVEIEFIKNLNTSWVVGISDTMSCHHLNSGFRYADQKKIEDSEILRPDLLSYFDEYTYKLFRCMKEKFATTNPSPKWTIHKSCPLTRLFCRYIYPDTFISYSRVMPWRA